MDTNTITLNLDGKRLIATLNVNGQIFGQVFKSRAIALEVYFKEARRLEEEGILATNSGILN